MKWLTIQHIENSNVPGVKLVSIHISYILIFLGSDLPWKWILMILKLSDLSPATYTLPSVESIVRFSDGSCIAPNGGDAANS
jgi:hypothetical protein